MEHSIDALPINFASPVLSEWHTKGKKRLKVSDDGKEFGTAVSDASLHGESKRAKLKNSSLVTDYSDPYAVATVLEGLDCRKFGSATRDIESLIAQNRKMLQPYFAKYPKLARAFLEGGMDHSKDSSKLVNKQLSDPNCRDIVVLEDVAPANKLSAAAQSVVIIDSDDDEDRGGSRPFFPFQEVVLSRPPGELDMNDLVIRNPTPRKARRAVGPSVDTEAKKEKGVVNTEGKKEKGIVNTEGKKEKGVHTEGKKEKGVVDAEGKKEKGVVDTEVKKDNGVVDTAIKKYKGVVDTENKKGKGVYVGIKEEDESYRSDYEDDSLNDMWKEMTMALEGSKDIDGDPSSEGHGKENGADCDHSFVLKDDLGYVCRVCGVIDRGIETIFEFQFNKGKRSTRTYVSDYRNAKDKEFVEKIGVILSENDLKVTDIAAHPRHMKQMKPHQVEGFNFLVKNLVSDNPGGCILAHAPGSGKTFMIISFMQSFLAKYPQARPLVVLPKGILGTWKKEFQTWQVEDIPLLDLYTGKVDNRSQQLEVLNQWVKQRSILFLGYKQFSSIVCDSATSNISASCQEILLKAPTILILDEGHTPRNEDTDVLQSLAKVQTPRKVVLSGTLYQNHVKEVFNILNLVRPKFLRLETSRSVVKRIMSRVQISGIRKQFKGGVDTAFYESVEHSLHKDEDFKRKVTVIHDLREMTSSVLHYYKGDFLDELPGLVDFTVLLKLSPRQKNEIDKLKKGGRKFKISSDGSAVSVHPKLITLPDIADNKIDDLLENLDVKDGVKAKFYLNMLKLCESADEKMLVFSQYLLPLKFLERLTVKFKRWSVGREIFFISGDTSSENREWAMEQFNNSPDAKVFFGSIKACGEGISLVGGSRVIILDVHLNPSVSRQALGRAFRPGQKKKVFTYRLVSADSPEEEDHTTCFKKESIAKMWFEWNEYCGFQAFEMETVDVNDSGDIFFNSPMLAEDVKALYKR